MYQPACRRSALCRAARDLGPGNFASVDQRIDTALGKARTCVAHAAADARTSDSVIAAVGEIIAHARAFYRERYRRCAARLANQPDYRDGRCNNER